MGKKEGTRNLSKPKPPVSLDAFFFFFSSPKRFFEGIGPSDSSFFSGCWALYDITLQMY